MCWLVTTRTCRPWAVLDDEGRCRPAPRLREFPDLGRIVVVRLMASNALQILETDLDHGDRGPRILPVRPQALPTGHNSRLGRVRSAKSLRVHSPTLALKGKGRDDGYAS